MPSKKPTIEVWATSSITVRCPDCKKVHRLMVGLKEKDDDQPKPKAGKTA